MLLCSARLKRQSAGLLLAVAHEVAGIYRVGKATAAVANECSGVNDAFSLIHSSFRPSPSIPDERQARGNHGRAMQARHEVSQQPHRARARSSARTRAGPRRAASSIGVTNENSSCAALALPGEASPAMDALMVSGAAAAPARPARPRRGAGVVVPEPLLPRAPALAASASSKSPRGAFTPTAPLPRPKPARGASSLLNAPPVTNLAPTASRSGQVRHAMLPVELRGQRPQRYGPSRADESAFSCAEKAHYLMKFLCEWLPVCRDQNVVGWACISVLPLPCQLLRAHVILLPPCDGTAATRLLS